MSDDRPAENPPSGRTARATVPPPEFFRAWFGRALESPAYRKFCEFHLGGFWGQLSPCDRHQRDALLALCPTGPETHLLDLGCGAGGLAALLVKRLSCQVTGLDRATPPASPTPAHHDRLRFEAVDLTTHGRAAESVDAVLLVDVLALLPEPRRLLHRWVRWLAPGGRLIVLGHTLSEVGSTPLGRRSDVANWLEELGLGVSEIDYDRFEQRFWRRQAETAERLTPEFQATGDSALRHQLAAEAQGILPWALEGRSHRRLTVGWKVTTGVAQSEPR